MIARPGSMLLTAAALALLPYVVVQAKPNARHDEHGIHAGKSDTQTGTVLSVKCFKPSDAHSGVSFNTVEIRATNGKVYQIRQSPIQPWVVRKGKTIFHSDIHVGDTVQVNGHPMGNVLHADQIEIIAQNPKKGASKKR